jgi:hypothetical protein
MGGARARAGRSRACCARAHRGWAGAACAAPRPIALGRHAPPPSPAAEPGPGGPAPAASARRRRLADAPAPPPPPPPTPAQLSKQHGALPLNLQGLQLWAVRALPSTNFAFAITALMFLTAPPVSALLPPYVIAAAYSAAGHAAAHHRDHPLWRSHGARAHAYLTANRQAALQLSAQLELSLGFFMLVSLLFPSRQLILTFFVVRPRRRRQGAAPRPPARSAAGGVGPAFGSPPLRRPATARSGGGCT